MKRTLIANALFWLLITSIVSMYAFIGFKIAGLSWSFFWILVPFGIMMISFYLIHRYYRDVFIAETRDETGYHF